MNKGRDYVAVFLGAGYALFVVCLLVRMMVTDYRPDYGLMLAITIPAAVALRITDAIRREVDLRVAYLGSIAAILALFLNLAALYGDRVLCHALALIILLAGSGFVIAINAGAFRRPFVSTP